MPLVADWFTDRMERHAELVTQDGRDARGHVDREGASISALRPGNHVVTDTDAPGDLAEAEPARASSVRQSFGGPVSKHSTAASASIGGVLSDRHDWIMVVADQWSIIRGLSREAGPGARIIDGSTSAGAGVRHPVDGARGGSGIRLACDLATGRSRARPRWSSPCPACGCRASRRTGGSPPPRRPRPSDRGAR
mgnify:CR=1 FL=1